MTTAGLMADMASGDGVLIGLLFAGMGLALVAVISVPLHFVIALRSPPSQRAGWSAGLAYLITGLLLYFGGMDLLDWLLPLFCLPGALIVFWFWRREYRRAWIDNPDLVPPGMTLENDDWRIGLATLFGFVFALAVKILVGYHVGVFVRDYL